MLNIFAISHVLFIFALDIVTVKCYNAEKRRYLYVFKNFQLCNERFYAFMFSFRN